MGLYRGRGGRLSGGSARFSALIPGGVKNEDEQEEAPMKLYKVLKDGVRYRDGHSHYTPAKSEVVPIADLAVVNTLVSIGAIRLHEAASPPPEVSASDRPRASTSVTGDPGASSGADKPKRTTTAKAKK